MPRRLTPSAVRAHITSGSLEPLYLIDGDDDAAKAALAAAFGDTVEPELRAFNVERLYACEPKRSDAESKRSHAGESDISDVLDAARTLPFGGGRRVVVVLHVERLAKRESEAAARGLAELDGYLKAPQPHATVVFVTGLPPVTGKIRDMLASRCTLVTCSTAGELVDARRWVLSRAAEAGVTLGTSAVRKLLELAGDDLVRLREDTERVLLFAAGAGQAELEDVLAVVGEASSQDEWAVVNAIERGAPGVALKELALMLDEGAVPVMVLGQFAWYVRNKMTPARVPAAVDALFRTDVALKSSGGDPRLLLERLVVELCQG